MTMLLLGAAPTAALLGAAGCTRHYYRERADAEAAYLVHQKACNPRWQEPSFNVYPDARSRFCDPYNPDRPPTPPDDPTSARYMRCVYKMHGYQKWYKDGVLTDVESPKWDLLLPTYTKTSAEGKMVLDLPSAVALGRLHNRDYQENIEEIYLAALDVAFERFRFDVQLFGGTGVDFLARGNEPSAGLNRVGQGGGGGGGGGGGNVIGLGGNGVNLGDGPDGPGNSSSSLAVNNRFGATRRFAAGAELLIGFANSFVWQFSGEDTNFAASLINFNLVQPLLRRGGRDVVLEQLTRAERSLLANLRSQAQYRQEFYRDLAFGGGAQTRPQRIGGFQGGAGLSGFTGTGQGGFGGVGAGQGFGQGGAGGGVGNSGAGAGTGLAGGGEGIVGGFFGLVQRLQAIRNTEASLASQLLTLSLLEALFDAGQIDLVQVDEFRQNIETERATLLRAQVAFQDNLENYLVTNLHLPPWLGVDVDDAILKPFELIERDLADQQLRASQLLVTLGDLPEAPPVGALREVYDELKRIAADGRKRLTELGAEVDSQAKTVKERSASNDETADRKEDADGLVQITRNFADLKKRFDETAPEIERLEGKIKPGGEKEALGALTVLLRRVAGDLQELVLAQARVRLEKVAVDPVDVSDEEAFLVAREYRLDWMNRRAALVDQWRLIAFNANRLESDLDIQIDGDVSTLGDNPVKFRAPTGTMRARLVVDAPLNRKGERNLYRESLIDYQRARRGYIGFVDRT
ncbi:MAG: hypothetical protein ACRDD1_16940, partial [Planctomycetia bacterium]